MTAIFSDNQPQVDMLHEGSLAPAFALESTEGRMITLDEFRGRWLVLYFYPKDMTPGCTTEACDFRDRHENFAAVGAAVLGVSADPLDKHLKFRDRHGLPFPLLSDTGLDVLQAYGVWKEKSLYGRRFMGIERSTVLIDPDGRIARVWPKVRVTGHADEVLNAIRAVLTT